MTAALRPRRRDAAYGGESVVLQNPELTVAVHRRTTGWGWAELLAPDGTLLGVLDHLGEHASHESPVPVRLEADRVVRSDDGDGSTRLTFEVRSVVLADSLAGTSFESWVRPPSTAPAMTGTVTLALHPTRPRLALGWRLEAQFDQQLRYLRGPWLYTGTEAGDRVHDDAVLPGVEWAVGPEWTSGTEWFRDPWAMRVVPHRNTVSVPLMSVSRGGSSVVLSWDPTAEATGWFTFSREHAQPVFSSPDLVGRRDRSLLGLMLPEARDLAGNGWEAHPPLELHVGQRVELSAEVSIVPGDGVDAVADWVRRHGLPEPPAPRWPAEETLHRIAEAMTTHLWHPGRGWGAAQTPSDVQPDVPAFAAGYLARFPSSPHAARLRECLATLGPAVDPGPGALEAEGRELLARQRPDGSFPFDPDGPHRSKDDLLVARDLVEPMGTPGDTALDLCMVPATRLLELADATGQEELADAARRALDHCLEMRRPEGGDYWETPLHAPNLLAAGHAAIAYGLAFDRFGDDRYRVAATHWLRSLLLFTHLWEPWCTPMLYDTKPCLCASDWYLAHWVRDHVQWEVLHTFAAAARHGLDLAALDSEIDWRRYRAGITWAAVRWLIDHTEDSWRPHNVPGSLDLYRRGAFDMCLPDTHNSVTGLYGGMAILPDTVAVNLLAILDEETEHSHGRQ